MVSQGGFEKVHQAEVTVGEAGPWYRHTGTAMGAVMWFWIEWRAYHDLGDMLVSSRLLHPMHMRRLMGMAIRVRLRFD